MKLISAVLNSLRFLVIIFTCTLLIFTSTAPAFAASNDSTTQEGKAAKIYTKRAQDTLQNAPQSMEEVQARTGGGLNEVQGKAGKENMKRPSNSQGATTAQEVIERVMDKVQNK
ncbi:hypothetical protein [Leptothermofonsia sp. ETS-13]|uniref:hypothetical protein n=1 Tax=Leptothermofonsia sp. ETS-13 TaxID=3035696 RepID=UPI003B9EF3AF